MNATKEIQAAEALSTKAAQKELSKDFDAAFTLYIKAAQAFLHLARTLPDTHAKSCRAAAGRSLERAELIKQAKRDVKPVAADPYSTEEQAYILGRSASVNGLRYPSWRETDEQDVGTRSELFRDPDGQPELPPQLLEATWRRPASALPHPQCMSDPALLPEQIVQNMVTDCSVVAAIVVCLGHQRRFKSKLGMSSIYPHDADDFPVVSANGMYTVRMFVNGTWRKIGELSILDSSAGLSRRVKSVIDDSLPFLTDGKLLGVFTAGDSNVLWPPLLEKAFMKLMGGYDFPGSNSGADLHTLVGWIPEHVHLGSAGFQMESTWNRILKGFSTGSCIVTAGTPASSSGAPSDDLILAHDYPIMDMQDDGSDGYIILLDPWRDRDEGLETRGANEGHDDGALLNASPFRRLTWRETCNRFDTIHINWDPVQFSHRLHIHGLWQPHKSPHKHSQCVSNRLRVFIEGAKTRDEELWVLLTRHIVNKNAAPRFISLNISLDDELRSIPPSEKLSVQGTYSDSVHVLRRISPGIRNSTASIIASIDETPVAVGYTITILSAMNVTVDTQPQQGFYSKTLEGTLTARNSGGNFTYPTFMINPQYHLHLQSNPAGGSSRENMKFSVRFCVEGPKDLPLNVKIVWSEGQRITELIEGDVVSDTGAYSYGMAFGECALKAGEYTLVVSSFEPRQQGPFELSVHSLHAFDLEAIPAEGAGMYSKVFRGTWDHETSAGAPGLGRYNFNPIIEVSIPSAAQIMIRLHLRTPSSPVALNATLFTRDASGGFGAKVLTSGPYSDAIAGALIPRSAIAPGKYLLVPSTYMSNVQAEFQVLLYSTTSGVELALRSA